MEPIHLLPMSKNVAGERGQVDTMFHLSEDQRHYLQMQHSEKAEAMENEQDEKKEQEY